MRLVHQLSLLLILAVLAAVLAVAGLGVWNLRAGFTDYLRAQDGEHLDILMRVAERDLAERGVPRAWRPALHRWLDTTRAETRGSEALGDDGGPEPTPPPPPRDDPSEGRPGDERPRPPLPLNRPGRQDPANFGPRVLVLGADGQTLLAGRPENLQREGQLRALKLRGETVAYLRLSERAGPAQGVDARFLRRQTLGLAGVGAAVLVLALLLGRWAAVRWTRPLRDAQVAARRVARGDFAHRVPAPLGRAPAEIAELHRDINGMAASLERFESSRQRWIAQLSHELRTPLAVLRGEIEALVDGVRPLDRAALGSLQEEVRRLARLVEDFHLLALSGLRQLPCEFGPVAPAALLQAVAERVSVRAAALGLQLDRDLPEVLPDAAWDADRVTQLLGNLLENSLRYTEAPGRVRLSARAVADAVQIRLEDSPPGVPAADLERIFDPLYRVDASRSRALGGSGLGLAIARAIAEGHGGTLRAEASSLGGVCMILTLPLKPSP
jgi:two-component system sensor histidine kinase BaeS